MRDFVEATAQGARETANTWAKHAWAIDTALSAWRKAAPGTGYRDNPALGDPPHGASGPLAVKIAEAVEAYRLAQGDHCTDTDFNRIVASYTREGDPAMPLRVSRKPDEWQILTDWSDI